MCVYVCRGQKAGTVLFSRSSAPQLSGRIRTLSLSLSVSIILFLFSILSHRNTRRSQDRKKQTKQTTKFVFIFVCLILVQTNSSEFKRHAYHHKKVLAKKKGKIAALSSFLFFFSLLIDRRLERRETKRNLHPIPFCKERKRKIFFSPLSTERSLTSSNQADDHAGHVSGSFICRRRPDSQIQFDR